METVLREEGTIEVKLASAAEQSRNVSREEEDAIRSGEKAVGWIVRFLSILGRRKIWTEKRKLERRCDVSNCHIIDSICFGSKSTLQAFSCFALIDINTNIRDHLDCDGCEDLTPERGDNVCETSFGLLHPAVAFDPW